MRDAATLAVAFASLAVALPFIFLSWLARRACYIHSKPVWAAAGGLLYLVLVSAGALALYNSNRLSVVSASMLIGVSSLVTSLWLLRRIGGSADVDVDELKYSTVLADHWQYGRWATGSGFLAWLPINLYYVLLPKWGGLEVSAALKALFNLILPILHSDSALTSLLVPVLVRARTSAGRFYHLVRLAALLLAVEGVAYWLMLAIFRKQLVVLVYGESYSGYANLLWLLGLLPLAAGLLNVLGSALRALEQADEVFWSTVASVTVTLTLGVVAAAIWGITGSIVGMLASWMAQIAAMIWFLSNRRKGLA
jgi:O-antigen/teichoic acid export membrane protein